MSAVIELQPQKDTAYLKKAQSLLAAKDIDGACKVVEEALGEDPNDAQALCLASEILKKCDKTPIAYSLAKRATELKPERPEPWSQLGHCSQTLWRMEEAQSCYRKALQRAKDDKQKVLYTNNLASVLLDTGQFVKAEKPCRDALKLSDKDVSVRHNLGLSLLAQHRWKEGWEYYSASVGGERRLAVKYKPDPEPTWNGVSGQNVVVYGEQGLGDEICAASMLPDAIRDCKSVIVDCDHRLEGLFKRSFPKAAVYGTRWAKPGQGKWNHKSTDIDASIAGFELGQFYRTKDEDFPGTPYLIPDPERVLMWKALWASKKKPAIGIAWSGGTWSNAGLHRKMPLTQWKPIFDAVDAHWVCLQYKDAKDDIQGTPVVQYPHATLTKDYDDTAALVASLDLVIAVQTSVVHLAGALGVPCWSLIPKTSQWRYGESGESLPWYKSVKMYRQGETWPVKRIADDLADFA